MNVGAENRKKMITAGALGAVALICIVYGYNTLFGGTSTPPPAIAPVSTTPMAAVAARTADASNTSSNANSKTNGTNGSGPGGGGSAAGVAATKLASTSASLDPTLDDAAMLRTESLVYAGNGRNIFSATYTPPPPPIPVAKFGARPSTAPIVPIGPPPIPPPPPINLKFFGTAKRANGAVQAFLLSGEDVYLAASGDIVARKYKIGIIGPTSIQVTDLQNNDTQVLPLTTN